MQLNSKRLSYTALTSDDWDLFHRLHKDLDVIKYICDPLSDNQIRNKFEERLAPWHKERDSWLCMVMTEINTGEAIGLTGFFSTWSLNKQAELGFMLHPRHQGKGYGLESTRLVLDFAFNTCSFHKVSATVTDGNAPSFNLLLKAGLKSEGTLRENFILNGEWKDDLKLGMLKQEFMSI